MTLEERLALHQRLADTYFDAYARHIERGAVVMSDEWRLSPGFLYSSGYHGVDAPAPIASLIEGAGNTNEMKVYLARIPNWRAVECLGWPTPQGFVTRTLWAGRTRDGRMLSSTLVNFWHVNEAGEITRCDGFINGEELGPVMEVVLGRRGPFKSFAEYWQALATRQREIDAGAG
jgi:hypothetical protein